MRKFIALTAVCLSMTACAEHSRNIQASYVSPVQYQEYSCKQIRGEMMRVSHKVNEVAGVQDKTASNDSVAMGVGLVLFWPALFFMAGHDQHVELAELKGQYDALQEVAIQKDCDVAKEVEAANRMQQTRELKQATQQKKAGEAND
jgi:hypothetical protein